MFASPLPRRKYWGNVPTRYTRVGPTVILRQGRNAVLCWRREHRVSNIVENVGVVVIFGFSVLFKARKQPKTALQTRLYGFCIYQKLGKSTLDIHFYAAPP
jgi:hypothetical protein